MTVKQFSMIRLLVLMILVAATLIFAFPACRKKVKKKTNGDRTSMVAPCKHCPRCKAGEQRRIKTKTEEDESTWWWKD